jgi:hypothetical protein
MRIRSVYPDFWSDSITGTMRAEVALLYIGLWSVADDAGRMEWDPLRFAAVLDPYGAKFGKPAAMKAHLGQLVALGRLVRYEVAGRQYAFIPTFPTWQKPNRPTPTRLPVPPLSEDSVRTHVPLREDSLCSVDVEEGSVAESREEEASPPQAAPLPSATPPAPVVAKRAKKSKDEAPSVEPLRKRLVAFIESKGVAYPDTTQAAERTNLKRVLATGVTEKAIEIAFEAAYARGGWHPRIQDVTRVITSASERPRGGNGVAAPVSDFNGVPAGPDSSWSAS